MSTGSEARSLHATPGLAPSGSPAPGLLLTNHPLGFSNVTEPFPTIPMLSCFQHSVATCYRVENGQETLNTSRGGHGLDAPLRPRAGHRGELAVSQLQGPALPWALRSWSPTRCSLQ